MRLTWLAALLLLAGCGGPDYARVQLSGGRTVIARVTDEPPGLDTGPELIPLVAEQVTQVEEVSQGEWHLAAGSACLDAGQRTEGLRYLRQALQAPERSVVEVARRRLEAALKEGQVEETAAATVTGKPKADAQPGAEPAPAVVLHTSRGANDPAAREGGEPADPDAVRKLEEKLRADKRGEPPRVPGVSAFDPAGEPPIAELRQFLFGASVERVLQALGKSSGKQTSGDRTAGLYYHAKGLWLHFDGEERLSRITVYLKDEPAARWKAYAGRVCGESLHRPTEAQLRQRFPDLRRKFDDSRVATWNGYELEFIIGGAWSGTLEIRPGRTPPPAPAGEAPREGER